MFDDINQGKMKMSITNEIDSLLWEAIKFVSVGYCKSLNHFFQDSETVGLVDESQNILLAVPNESF